ncbi:MAG: hypothetical protein GY759_20025 [Chloroflexi bacterium]|nr:hypothetical protein [Chloroflexota bacterium]
MVTQTAVQTTFSTLGQRLLRINAFFSGLSGLALTVAASPIAAYMGIPSPLALAAAGIGLMGFAIFLYSLASRPVSRSELITIAILDIVWVAGSALLGVAGWIPFTTAGKWAVALTAEIVFWFAVAEFYAAWRINRWRA